MNTTTTAKIDAAVQAATPEQLANYMALRVVTDYPANTCVAWMDSAERVCARTVAAGHLCMRHENVARKRLAASITRQLQRAGR